jgi:hypothetical protein
LEYLELGSKKRLSVILFRLMVDQKKKSHNSTKKLMETWASINFLLNDFIFNKNCMEKKIFREITQRTTLLLVSMNLFTTTIQV